MRLLFTALACLINVSISAQVITYPYNPDSDTDNLIAIQDLMDLLTVYGNEFFPESVTVDGVVITEWLEQNGNSVSGGGCDFNFPDGVNGEFITAQLCNTDANPTPYTVPDGNTLYITSAQSDYIIYIEDDFGNNTPIVAQVNNSEGFYGSHTLHNPIIVGEGKTVSGCSTFDTKTVINGLLIENYEDNRVVDM